MLKLIISFLFYFLFFKASREGHLEVVGLLINNERFNCLNEKDKYGDTALHLGEYLNVKINYFFFI